MGIGRKNEFRKPEKNAGAELKETPEGGLRDGAGELGDCKVNGFST
jgi:hypothetical protein